MKYRSRTAYPEPSTPLTVFDRHAAAAFQSLLDDKPLLEPLREAVYGPWMRPLHAVAVAYAAGGQAAAAARFTQLARRSRGLRTPAHPLRRGAGAQEHPRRPAGRACAVAARGRARPGARRPHAAGGQAARRQVLALAGAGARRRLGQRGVRTQRQGPLPGAGRSALAAAAPPAPARRHAPACRSTLPAAGRSSTAAACSSWRRRWPAGSAWSSSTP